MDGEEEPIMARSQDKPAEVVPQAPPLDTDKTELSKEPLNRLDDGALDKASEDHNPLGHGGVVQPEGWPAGSEIGDNLIATQAVAQPDDTDPMEVARKAITDRFLEDKEKRGRKVSRNGTIDRIKMVTAHNLAELEGKVNGVLEVLDGAARSYVKVQRDASDYLALIKIEAPTSSIEAIDEILSQLNELGLHRDGGTTT